MKVRSHFTERLGLHPKSQLGEEAPKTPFQSLMTAIRKRFGAVSPTEVSRLKRLRPEQQEHLLDVVVLAENVEFFLSQIPISEPAPAKPKRTNSHLTHNLGDAMQKLIKTNSGQPVEKEIADDGYDQPPPAPKDPEKLGEAVNMLRVWREIAGDPAQRYRLKDILTRFPRNNYVASIWLEHFEPILAQRLPPGQPWGALLIAQPTDFPNQKPNEEAVEVFEPEPKSPNSFVSSNPESISGPESEPSEPMPMPNQTEIAQELFRTTLSKPETHSTKPGLSFAVQTKVPFPAEMKVFHAPAQGQEGKRLVTMLLVVPEEEMYFAQGVAKRMKDFPDLETRLAEAAKAYFMDAEQQLDLHIQFHPSNPVQVSTEEKKSKTIKSAPKEIQTQSASDKPKTGGRSRKSLNQLAAEEVFFDHFRALSLTIREKVGSLRQVFSTKTNHLVRSTLGRTCLPQPSSFLKILSELAQLSLSDRKAVWPKMEPVIEEYKTNRGEQQAYKLLKNELERVYSRLAER